jgi:hypothetical protein
VSRRTKSSPQPIARNALADFARVFWYAALREVEARIDAEEAEAAGVAQTPSKAKGTKGESRDNG